MYWQGDYYTPQQQQQGSSGAEQAANAGGKIAGAVATKYVASKLAGSAAAGATGGSTGGSIAAPTVVGVKAVPAGTGGGSAATGVSAGTIGAGAGIAAGIAGTYMTHQAAKRSMAESGRKNLTRKDFDYASSPTVHLGLSKKPSGVEKLFHRIDPIGNKIARTIFSKWARPSTKSYQRMRWDNLVNQGVLSMEDSLALRDPNSPNWRGRQAQGLAEDFVGYDEAGQWVNNKFARSRRVEDLRPEDIVGSQTFYESFGNDWIGSFNHQQRLAIAQKALNDGQITEGRGMIEIKDPAYVEELYKYAEQVQKGEDPNAPKVEQPAQAPAQVQAQSVQEMGQVPYQRPGDAPYLKSGYSNSTDQSLLALQAAQAAASQNQRYSRPSQQVIDMKAQQGGQAQGVNVPGYEVGQYQRPAAEGDAQYLKGPTSAPATVAPPPPQTFTMGDGTMISLEELMAKARQMGISLYRPSGEIDKRLLADAGSLKRWRESGR